MDGSCLYRGKYLLYYTSTVSTYWVMSTWSRCMINATPALECLGSRNPTHRAMGTPPLRCAGARPVQGRPVSVSCRSTESKRPMKSIGRVSPLDWVGGSVGAGVLPRSLPEQPSLAPEHESPPAWSPFAPGTGPEPAMRAKDNAWLGEEPLAE